MSRSSPLDYSSRHRTLGARLRDALRISFFLRVDESRMAAHWGEYVAAALLSIVGPTLYGLYTQGGEGKWDLGFLPSALFDPCLAVVAAGIIAWLVGRRDSAPRILFAALLALIVIDAVSIALWMLAGHVWDGKVPPAIEVAAFQVPLLWYPLAVARFASPMSPSKAGRMLAMLAAVAVLALPVVYLQPERSLWVRDWSRNNAMDAASFQARTAAGHENAINAQPGLLARELEAVAKERPGVVDVFFIGMAGYGNQDVFMREVDAVTRLMRERFDAGGRVIRLVNNPKTVYDTPIASLTHLKAAFARVREQMNTEEDVLVLFLTSHGSEQHRFSLVLQPLQFNELDPVALRKALDDSGIRNRVVVVSACYSGGFVEPLKDENTLVIAAAAPDRNSFGCSNEAEWTYFGRAFFDEALRKTYSFVDAFELALPVIASREVAEKFEPSRPMMHVGAAIKERLAALAGRLAALPQETRAAPATSHPPTGTAR